MKSSVKTLLRRTSIAIFKIWSVILKKMKVTERKTIISRISRVGEETDPEAFKGIEKAFYNVGVSIKSSSDTIRPLGEILSSLASRWVTLNDVEKSNVAQQAAGVYRRNYFITLMNSYQDVLKNTEAATNSEGVAMSKQEIYSNSLAASISRLTSAWEKFYLNSINTNSWKLLVQSLTTVITGFAKFADVVGGIPAVLSTVILAVSLLSGKFKNFMMGLLGFNTIGTFITSLKSAQMAMLAFNGTKMSLGEIAWARLSQAVIVYTSEIKAAYIAQRDLSNTSKFSALRGAWAGLTTAINGTAIAAKAAGVAISIGLGVATLGLSVVLSLVIGKVMAFADAWIHAKEKAKEAFDTLQKNIATSSSEIAQSATLIKIYDELSAKVNKTTEEKTALAEVTEKLSSLFPQSITGYDLEGKAILGSADSLREYLDVKKQQLELDKQQLVSNFYKNESSQVEAMVKNQKTLNDLRLKQADVEDRISRIKASTDFTPEQKSDLLKKDNAELEGYKSKIAEARTNILKANADMSSGLKATVQTELESLNLSSTSINNFSKSYMGMIDKIKVSGQEPSQVLSQLFNAFKTDSNIKPIIDDWNKSLDGLQKGSIDASKAEEIHTKAVKSLGDELKKANPDISPIFINAFVDGFILLSKVAPEAVKQIKDVKSVLDEVDSSTEKYLKKVEDLTSTVAKMNDGHKLTVVEIQKLLKAHPELAQALTKENGLLTLNKSAIDSLINAKDTEYKNSLEQSRVELVTQQNATTEKLKMYGIEIKSIQDVDKARRTALENQIIDSGGMYKKTYGGLFPKGIANEATNASKDINDALDKWKDIQEGITSIDLASQITPQDLINSSAPDLNKKDSTASTNLREQVSIEDSLIKSFQTDVKITEEKNKILTKQIELAKSQKDYNTEIQKTNLLIQGQSTQMSQLAIAKQKIEAEFAKVASESKLSDIPNWMDEQGNATLAYQTEWNNPASSKENQKEMTATFDKLSKLKKAYYDNGVAVDNLTESQQKLGQSLKEINTQIADEVIAIYKKAYEQEKEIVLKTIEQESTALENAHQKKLDMLDEEYNGIEKVINAKIKSIDLEKASEDYTQKLSKAQKEASDIQSQIDLKVLDDSISAKGEREKLTKDLLAKNEELAQLQKDHDVELRKQNLQDELDTNKTRIENNKKNTTYLVEGEQRTYEVGKKFLDKRKADMNYFYTEQINNEQNIAKIKEDINRGNLEAIKAQLLKFSAEFKAINQDTAKSLGISYQGLQGLNNEIGSSALGKTNVYGKKADIDLAKTVSNASKFNFITTNDASQAEKGSIVLGGTGAIKSSGMGERIGGFDASETFELFKKRTVGFAKGGINDTPGFYPLHGTSSSVETFFNATQGKKLLDFVNNLPNVMPNIMNNFKMPSFTPLIPSMAGSGGGDINLTVHIANLNGDKSGLNDFFTQIGNGMKKHYGNGKW